MATRKIKDAVDRQTNEKIYFRGHAQATFTSDGKNVEEKLEQIAESVGNKQDNISDLATIRSNANKGATALQSVPAEYVTETELTNKGYATKTELNNGLTGKVSTISGKGLSSNDYTTTEKNKLAGIATGAEVNVQSNWTETDTSSDAYIKNKPSLATVATSGSYTDLKDKPTIPDSLSDLSADSTHRTVTDTEKATWNAKSNFSGSYTDLTDKPTIPSAVTESTVSGWGFTKNTGTYSKPSTGIPKSDLASAVQTSLSKADTALQSYTEQYTGTYSKPSGGIPKLDLASAVQTSLEKADTALQSYTETDPVFKASAAANISLSDIDNWNSKISQPAYTLINQGTSNTNIELAPNTLYVWGTVSALTLTFGAEVSGVANEYIFQFTCGSTATTLSLPASVKWAGGEAPTIEASKTYQVSILNNCATLLAF